MVTIPYHPCVHASLRTPSSYNGWDGVVKWVRGAGLMNLYAEALGAGFDLVEPGVNRLESPPDSPDALAKCMDRFFDAPDLLRTWDRASREKAPPMEASASAAKWVEALQYVRTA